VTRILFVDDDPGLCRLVARRLRADGFIVETLCDGQAGLASLAAGGFDAVALDHNLPGEDGMAVLARIRQLADPPPVVMVTAAQDSRLVVAALKAGAADYVVKDVEGEFLTLLATALDGAVEQARVRREHEAVQRSLAEALARAERVAAERAVLIQEISHRVGNSLQIVAAILSLKASAADEPGVRKALDEARERVYAVAAVHRRLYQKGSVESIGAAAYLSELVEDLRREHATAEIAWRPLGTPFEVALDRAVALGVVLSELVMNAFKYAYPAGAGPVRVALERDNGTAVLTVEDDGVGLDDGAPRGTGIGALIVRSMVAKLEGLVDRDASHAGTRMVVRFPIGAAGSPTAASA